MKKYEIDSVMGVLGNTAQRAVKMWKLPQLAENTEH
jgi:hypothetical protein